MSKSAPSVAIEPLLASRPNAPLPLPGVSYAEQVDAGDVVVVAPAISDAALQALAQKLSQDGQQARVLRAGRWHEHDLLRLGVAALPSREWCRQLADRIGIDIGLLPQSLPAQLVLFDMDSTLITMETIDELADMLKLKVEVAAITARAMRGEIEYDQSLRERLALLKGLDESALQRARRIRDELQRRAGDRARPPIERDYIDRLLQEF